MKRNIFIAEICSALCLQYIGENVEINGLNLCNRRSEHNRILTYATSESFIDYIRRNQSVVAIILRKEDLYTYQEICNEKNLTVIICDDPEKTFYDIHDFLYYRTDFYEKFDFVTKIGENSLIHPSAVVDKGVIIGKNVKIGANTVIRRGTVIRDNCVIGCNTTIGSEGFQILRIGGINRKIIHCGGTLLNEGVYVGDNVTVCNALFEGELYIGKGTMIDNLVHVGHNVFIGNNAVITAGAILCGSSVIKDNAWIGVNSSVLNRITVGEGSKIGIGSVVTRDVLDETLAYGVPARMKKKMDE